MKWTFRTVVRRCLTLCDERGARSIAFPALATGAARLIPEESATAILVETLKHLEGDTLIDEVNIVLDPSRRGDIGARFYSQVAQYMELTETARRVDSALSRIEHFPTDEQIVSDVNQDRERLATIREGLDTDMLQTREFGLTWGLRTAHPLRQQLDTLEHSFAAAIQTSLTNPATPSLQIPLLRIQLEKVALERHLLNWRQTEVGSITEEDRQREALYHAQEEKFKAALRSLETSQSRPLVISLHGIRTRGTWQKTITRPLEDAGLNHEPLDYGHFGLVRFLSPRARQKRVDIFRDEYHRLTAQTGRTYPSIIAHSLGSYIVTHAMEKYSLAFDKVILSGAIVSPDYDWDEMFRYNLVTRVLNDHGRLDMWARLAAYVVRDAGQSGLTGFQNTANGKVINRDHRKFGHSDYFYPKNYSDSWIPFLQGKEPAPLPRPERSAPNWRFYLTIAGILFTILLGILFHLFTR